MTDKPIKLSSTGRAMLMLARTRGDRLLRPPTLPVAAARQVVRSMLSAGVIEEIELTADIPEFFWREADDGRRLALRTTEHGLAAIGAAQAETSKSTRTEEAHSNQQEPAGAVADDQTGDAARGNTASQGPREEPASAPSTPAASRTDPETGQARDGVQGAPAAGDGESAPAAAAPDPPPRRRGPPDRLGRGTRCRRGDAGGLAHAGCQPAPPSRPTHPRSRHQPTPTPRGDQAVTGAGDATPSRGRHGGADRLSHIAAGGTRYRRARHGDDAEDDQVNLCQSLRGGAARSGEVPPARWQAGSARQRQPRASTSVPA